MAPRTPDPFELDPAKRARQALDVLLDDKGSVPRSPEDLSIDADPRVDVETARQENVVLAKSVARDRARVLFFTTDISILRKDADARKRLVDLRHVFAEVHVILLAPKTEDASIVRLAETVWIYPIGGTRWWKRLLEVYRIIEKELMFANELRADIVVGEDMFEAGLFARLIARKYGRAFQLHISEDFFDTEYVQSLPHPTIYKWVSWYVLTRATSVRTKSEAQLEAVQMLNAVLRAEAEVLPVYHDLSAWRDATPALDLHERYPQFKFVMLHVCRVRTRSHTKAVIDGAAPILKQYRTVGLIILCDTLARKDIEAQAAALGLQDRIICEPLSSDTISYIKTANLLIHLSDDRSEDGVVLAAAATRVPVIANKNGVGGELFVDNTSARLCLPEDVACVTESITMYLNDNRSRTTFGIAAEEVVLEQVSQDRGAYLVAYAESVERSLRPQS